MCAGRALWPRVSCRQAGASSADSRVADARRTPRSAKPRRWSAARPAFITSPSGSPVNAEPDESTPFTHVLVGSAAERLQASSETPMKLRAALADS
jgi:hypothetical protein